MLLLEGKVHQQFEGRKKRPPKIVCACECECVNGEKSLKINVFTGGLFITIAYKNGENNLLI